MLGLTSRKLELLKFYVTEASPYLVHASGHKDAPWMKSAIQLAKRSPALTASCLTFAQMMLYNMRNDYRYLLRGNIAHAKRLGRPPADEIVGYVPLSEKQDEKLLVMFTESLAKLKIELINLPQTKNYNCVLIACVMVSMCSKAIPTIPLLSFDSQADMFGILRIINDIQTLYLGQKVGHDDGGAPLPRKHYLPRDDLLWAIPNLTKDEKLKQCLLREINTLTELYCMDVEGTSSAHLTAWSVYWHPDFMNYVRSKNPYALLVVCFYCAYIHRYHGLCWWGDRLQFDLQDIVDELPEELKQYAAWPMEEVLKFDYDMADEMGLSV
ncbi:hypothetical protein CJU89_6702 [Yarrowia sp. B02]|nr:hypothetical protein CJU89_6702 [Yarrowia sp. B02]